MGFSYKAINMPKRHRLAFFDAQERPKNRVSCWLGNLSLIYINLAHIRSQKPRKVFFQLSEYLKYKQKCSIKFQDFTKFNMLMAKNRHVANLVQCSDENYHKIDTLKF